LNVIFTLQTSNKFTKQMLYKNDFYAVVLRQRFLQAIITVLLWYFCSTGWRTLLL